MTLVSVQQKKEMISFARYYSTLSVEKKKKQILKLITPLKDISNWAKSTITLLSMPLYISEEKLDELFDAMMFDIYYYRVNERYEDYKQLIAW